MSPAPYFTVKERATLAASTLKDSSLSALIRRGFTACVFLVCIFVLLLVVPCPQVWPFRIELGQEQSPDGTLVAYYSWCPDVLSDIVIPIAGRHHLTVVNAKTHEVVLRHSTTADGPDLNAAKYRTSNKLTWTPKLDDE